MTSIKYTEGFVLVCAPHTYPCRHESYVQVHFLTSIETVAKGLAECVKLGLTKTVGVSNYSEEHMVRMYEGGR